MNDVATNHTATKDTAMNNTAMIDTAKQNPHPRGRMPEPRLLLDPKMRARICSLLALGYSIRMAAEHIGCLPDDITDATKEDPRFRDQIASARSDADIDALKLLRRTASQEKNWRVAAWILERRNPEEYGRRSPNSFTGEQVMEILGRVLDTVMPSVPRAEVAEVMFEVEEELADVVAKARLPLPEYDLPEDQESEEEGIPPQIASEAPPSATSVPPQASSPPDTAAASVAERQVPASVPALNDSGKRVSCLQQFVQRVPKAAPAAAGSNTSRPAAGVTRCATLSAGPGQLAAAAAKS